MRLKTLFITLLVLISYFNVAFAADTLFVKEAKIPILIERQDNVLCYLRLNTTTYHKFDKVILNLGKDVSLSDIASVKIYYGGTEARQDYAKNRFASGNYLVFDQPNRTLSALPSYAVLKAKVNNPMSRNITLTANQSLFPGVNFFWISIQMRPKASIKKTISATISSASADNKALIISQTDTPFVHRMGIGVRHAGDDAVNCYRIPGLVTTNKGTLIAVYDVRYNSGMDLQEHIDIGSSRSIDGGQTWEKMRLPLHFGEYGGLPAAQNGVGDPSVLVDTKTNNIWVVAAWSHGMGTQRSWFSSHPGMDLYHTSQLMLSKSTDDGRTWSAPINITSQVKRPEWRFLLQGPGRGITMKDGTLVFPIQFIDSTSVPYSGIMFSKDRGEHWTLYNGARSNTTEAQVAEVAPGVLMLNMRDNRGGSRAVSITTDMGKTWSEHVSNRSTLPESVCQASLIHVDAAHNGLNKDLLLFSNPNTTKGRHHITIKASLDGGVTWQKEHQLLLDEGDGWGYSCLTMIDKNTIGILYESSVAEITFQSIPLKDVVQ
jgi:sialidase-1